MRISFNSSLSFVVAALVFLTTALPVFAETGSDEIAQLKLRVAQLEKQVEEMAKFLEPLKGQQAGITSRRKALQGRIERRIAADREKYSQDEILEAEKLYRVISQKPGTQEATDSFKTMREKFPENNRTGCATLYMAQRSQGEDRIKLLQECIEKYGDSMYGDAVQVGAYARHLLAREYLIRNEIKKAEDLAAEIKTKFSDAVDHAGNLLSEIQNGPTK